MPYKQITQLPDSVKNNLPKGAQEIYKQVFNSAEDQYGEEDRAHRVAWSAVENKLRFMGLGSRESTGNYRVKIYG
jgi:cation transport regulator